MLVNPFKITYMLSWKHLNAYSLVNIKSLRAQFYTNCLFLWRLFSRKRGLFVCVTPARGLWKTDTLGRWGTVTALSRNARSVSLARNAKPHPPGVRRLTRLSSGENLRDDDDDSFAWFQVWFSSLFFRRIVACRSFQRRHFPKAFGFLKILAWQMQTLCTYYYFNLRSVV